MAKKGVEIFQPKITRNDRFAQMSHQEKIIEQKKKEIQLKLEAKQKLTKDVKASTTTTTTATTPSTNNNNNSINNNQIKSKRYEIHRKFIFKYYFVCFFLVIQKKQ